MRRRQFSCTARRDPSIGRLVPAPSNNPPSRAEQRHEETCVSQAGRRRHGRDRACKPGDRPERGARCAGGWRRAGRRASTRSTARSMRCASASPSSPTVNSRCSRLRAARSWRRAGVGRVQQGTVECGHTLTAFYIGKNPVYAFDSGVAFGVNTRQQKAWMYYGGGLELMREIFLKSGILNVPCGNVGVQMGGFFRKEINTVDDLNGLPCSDRRSRRHHPGEARCGAAADRDRRHLFRARARHDRRRRMDRSLRRREARAAQGREVLLHPGWWEGSALITLLVNAKAWDALPQLFKDALKPRRRAEPADEGQVRRQKPRGARACSPAAPSCGISASGAGRVLQGNVRDLRRTGRQERRFQPRLQTLAEVPARRIPGSGSPNTGSTSIATRPQLVRRKDMRNSRMLSERTRYDCRRRVGAPALTAHLGFSAHRDKHDEVAGQGIGARVRRKEDARLCMAAAASSRT